MHHIAPSADSLQPAAEEPFINNLFKEVRNGDYISNSAVSFLFGYVFGRNVG